ncbi:DUF2520 domain-containing protein [Microbacterium sp.]|uniref:DUF2520 domain-containing protein n=1 Tax=Microbacterium sp. TaxID=51671 RepID=UPI002811C98E|nr:DUF2520 domain-containing protein [Microbacterium sp.]
MPTASSLAPDTTIAVIGAGRLGTVLAGALRAAGFDVRGPLRRDHAIPESDVALLCVPDEAIPAAAADAATAAQSVGHVSGATGLDAVDFSIHPLQTFTGSEPPEVLHGIGAAVDARTPAARSVAEQLVRVLGMTPFEVGDRAGYHAAASVASNFVLTVLDAAEGLAIAAGIRNARDVLAPLVGRTVQNWREHGAANALTGPIVRGDEATVTRQRTAVAAMGRPELTGLFDALTTATRALAREQSETAGRGQP